MSSLNSAEVTIKFFLPDNMLRPYISTYYLTEVTPGSEPRISDRLHPEWANLRFIDGVMPLAAIGDVEPCQASPFSVTGPTSKATLFQSGAMRAWGIGLLPLGWAKFIDAPAEDYADKTIDGAADPASAPLAALHDVLYAGKDAKVEREVAAINAFFRGQLAKAKPDNPLVQRAHEVLVDPDLGTVQDMAERLNITSRTLDRLSRKIFGFAPKLLLRRQRFLRTLSENMLNPEQNWVSTLDYQYYDQAHFGRDFKRFMGMSASKYKALPHPFMNAAVHGRKAAIGAGMQALHDPKGDD